MVLSDQINLHIIIKEELNVINRVLFVHLIQVRITLNLGLLLLKY